MRRAVIAFLAAILSLGTFGSVPARAEGITSFVLELAESRLEGTQDSTGNTDFFIDLSKVSASWFTGHYAVFDARITYDMAAVLDPACPPMITLYTSDASKSTTGPRVRRSASPNIAVQRVAIGQPQLRYYLLSVRRNAAGIGR